MQSEVKALREAEGGLAAALRESEAALNRAAEAVVALKYEGVSTLKALEAERGRASDVGAHLAGLVARAEFHVGARR